MLILNIEYSNQKKWFASSSVLLYFYPTELENDIKQRIIILNSDHRAVVGVKSDLLSDTRGGRGVIQLYKQSSQRNAICFYVNMGLLNVLLHYIML